jgi:hypothetical protein
MTTTKSRSRSRSSSPIWRKLVARHRRQILERSDADHAALTSRIAIAFRPGDRTDSFLGKAIQPLGKGVLVALSYDYDESETDKPRRRLQLSGFRARADSDGSVYYGGPASSEFEFDGAVAPSPGARGQTIDPVRDPSLVDVLNQMDRCCCESLRGSIRLSRAPFLPQILLAFEPCQPPEFEDSPALRRLAAKEIGVPVERLGANGHELLDLLLRDCWRRQLIASDAPQNPTGTVLISADLCTQRRDFLRIYEDMTHLIGQRTWNPARDVTPFEAANPAREVLAKYQIDTRQNFNQPIDFGLIDELGREMRHRLGPVQAMFSHEEILDGITTPNQPLKAWVHALPQLRRKLNRYISECTTDDDLLQATRHPNDALFARGASRIQVHRRRPIEHGESLRFESDDLGQRIGLDLQTRRDDADRANCSARGISFA